MAHSSDKSLCLHAIKDLKPGLENWKIKVNMQSSTTKKSETEYENKNLTGRRFVLELKDDSGRIDLVAFDEDAKKLESFNFMNDTKYYIWGAEVQPANKKFSYPDRTYELMFNRKTDIKPAKGGHSLREIETPSSDIATKDPKPTIFDPTPMDNIDVGKPELHFDVLGILQETAEPIRKENRKSGQEFFSMKLRLSDTTGTVDVYVIGNEENLSKLTELEGQVIGLVGCIWKEYGKDTFISSYLDKLLKETDLPKNTRDKVIVLKKRGGNGGATPDNMTEKKKNKGKKGSKAEGLIEDMEKLNVNK